MPTTPPPHAPAGAPAASPPGVRRPAAAVSGGRPATLSQVSFVPYIRGNPYQSELARGLHSLGIEVLPEHGLKWLLRSVIARRKKPEIIHLHWLPRFRWTLADSLRYLLYFVRLAVLRMLGCRIVWTVHNLHSHEGTAPRIERAFTRVVIALASQIIVHSPIGRRLFLAEFGLAASHKLAVVPHGNYIDAYANTVSRAEARERLGLDPRKMVVLFLGYLRPYKGVNDLIRSFRQVDAPESTLLIAGKPIDDDAVAQLRATAEGDQRVDLRPGFVPDADVQLYMNAADVVVFPYQDVLTSGAVILAMSFGRACIAPALGCIPDVLDSSGAFLYVPEAPDALRTALQQAYHQRDALDMMGAHNIKTAAQWDWDAIAAQTARVYRQASVNPNQIGIPAT